MQDQCVAICQHCQMANTLLVRGWPVCWLAAACLPSFFFAEADHHAGHSCGMPHPAPWRPAARRPPCRPSPHNGPCHRDISFPPNPKPCKPCPNGVYIQGTGLRCLRHSLGRILSSRQSSAVHGQVVRQLSVIGWHIMLNPRCRLRQRHSQHLRCGALPVPCAPPEVFQCGRLGPPWCAAGVGC